MAHRIFLTGSGVAPEVMHFLSDQGCVCEVGCATDTAEDLERKLKLFDPHALIVRQGQITDAVQVAAKNLKVISKHGVGTDNIDIDAATRHGVVVTYTPGANTQSVAEHTLALIFALCRSVPRQDQLIRAGHFDKKNYFGTEISEKTLGLIGFGKVARRVVELISPFNMSVLVYHPSHLEESLPRNIEKVRSPDQIFERADIISLHAPLTDQTKGMINKSAFAKMKRSVFIINTARGAIIDEKDLLEAARSNRIGGAALDCFSVEPVTADNPLLELDNIIVTPHVAGISDASLINMGMFAARNALAVLRHETLDMGAVKNPQLLNYGT